MSPLALSQLRHGARAHLHALSDRWNDFLNRVGEARAIAERFKLLSRLSDAELAHYGLARVVWAGPRR
jgi:hypothetical protein